MTRRKLPHDFREGSAVWPRIHALLQTGTKSRDEIASALDIPVKNVAPALTKMKAQGVIRHAGRQAWEAVPREQWPATRGKKSVVHYGPESPTWNGGRYVNDDGYVLINVGRGEPMADCRGYVYEHRLVASQRIGRPLLTEEQVHHKDEKRQNNEPDNLEVLTLPEHKVEHRVVGLDRRLPGQDNPTIACACQCGGTFQKFDRWGRPRVVVPGHNRAIVRAAEAA